MVATCAAGTLAFATASSERFKCVCFLRGSLLRSAYFAGAFLFVCVCFLGLSLCVSRSLYLSQCVSLPHPSLSYSTLA